MKYKHNLVYLISHLILKFMIKLKKNTKYGYLLIFEKNNYFQRKNLNKHNYVIIHNKFMSIINALN